MTGPTLLRLASTSPRRRELLAKAGISFVLVDPGDDGPVASSQPEERVLAHALFKAEAGRHRLSHPAPVLAADTLVFVDGEALPQPQDRADAEAMLRRLSGRWHQVWTGVVLLDPSGESWSQADFAEVEFARLSEKDLAAYLDSGEWQGKAGAYAIQGRASAFASLRVGFLETVIGLNVATVQQLLQSAGVEASQPSPCPENERG